MRKDWGIIINWKRLKKYLNIKYVFGLDFGFINDIIRIIGKILLEFGEYMVILD